MPSLVPLVPNWATSVKETYEFKTDILQSRNNTEQRRAARNTPRLNVRFDAMADGDRRRTYEQFMQTMIGVDVLLPDYVSKVRSLATLFKDATTFVVNEVPEWLVAGAAVALENKRNIERAEILSVSDHTLTLAAGASRQWASGTRVRPLHVGIINGGDQSTVYTSQVAVAPIDFDVAPGSLLLDTGTSFATLDGREIFTIRPNWAQDPTTAYDVPIDTIDYGMGRTAYFVPYPFSNRTFQATYLERSSEEALLLKQFFLRMQGARGYFYTPSWTDDMDLVSAVNGATTLTLAGRNIFDRFSTSDSHRAIWLQLKTGDPVALLFDALTTDGTNTILTLQEPLAQTITPNQVRQVCWLYPSRFASDTLVIEWITTEVAQMVFSIQAIKYHVNDDNFDGLDEASRYMIATYGLNFTLDFYAQVDASMYKWVLISAGLPRRIIVEE